MKGQISMIGPVNKFVCDSIIINWKDLKQVTKRNGEFMYILKFCADRQIIEYSGRELPNW